jgi:5-methylcytosine-specific restriction enzyme A
MSTQRKMPGGRVRRTRERGPHGKGICRWCRREVTGRRRTFCSDDCVHEWRLRTDPGYLRQQVLLRDRGICAICGLDAIEFYRRFQRIPARKRRALSRQLDMHPRRRSFWDADHILAVAEGGGECDLSNIRTLCLWCHQENTAQLRRRLKDTNAGRPIREAG